jgi:hypothetical protein
MTVEMRQPGGGVLIQLDGTFDLPAARDVGGRLAALPVGTSVVIDFSHVKQIMDLGVAALVSGLSARDGPHVAFRGLCRHQHRLFRYFGLDLDAWGKAESPASERG